jgi:hypothetical protein
MNTKRLAALSVLLLGSLWGLAELGIGEIAYAHDVPRAPLLTAIGVLIMVLMRAVWQRPGSTLAVAAVASAMKLLQHPVWGCKLAAVVLLGAVFEVGFTAYEAAGSRGTPRMGARRGSAVALSAALTFVSFVLFGYFARYALANPYWALPGRLIDYQFVQGSIAALLAVPAALAGLALADHLRRASVEWSRGLWLAYRTAAVGSGIAGVAAALALRY